MSVAAVRAVLEMRGVLTTAERFVLLAMAEHASGQDGRPLVAWPSASLLAAETGTTREHVQRCLKVLRDTGYLTQAGKRPGGVNAYRVNLDTIKAAGEGRDVVSQGGEVTSQGSDLTSLDGVTSGHTEPSTRTDQEPTSEPMATTGLLLDFPATTTAPSGDGFDDWWEHYPRKVKKADARRAYAKALKRPGITARFLVEAVKAYRFSEEARFIPYPASWLNSERWEDDPRGLAPRQHVRRNNDAHTDHWATPGAGF